jgi:hypothetical protein
MSMPAASRIQSATTRANGGQVSRGSFAARAQSAAAHNALTTAPLASSKGRN